MNRALARLARAFARAGAATARAAASAARATARTARRLARQKKKKAEAESVGRTILRTQSLPANLNQVVSPAKEVKARIDIKNSLRKKVSLVIKKDSKGSVIALNVSPQRATIRQKFRAVGRKLLIGTAFTLFIAGVGVGASRGIEAGIDAATNSTPLTKNDILDTIEDKYDNMQNNLNATIEKLNEKIDLAVSKISEANIRKLNHMSAIELVTELQNKLVEDGTLDEDAKIEISIEDVDDLDKEFQTINPEKEQKKYISEIKTKLKNEDEEEEEEEEEEDEEEEEEEEEEDEKLFMKKIMQQGKKEWEKIKQKKERQAKKKEQREKEEEKEEEMARSEYVVRKKRSTTYQEAIVEAIVKDQRRRRCGTVDSTSRFCIFKNNIFGKKASISALEAKWIQIICRKGRSAWKKYRTRNRRNIWETTEEEEEKFWKEHLEKAKILWAKMKREKNLKIMANSADRAGGFVDKAKDNNRTAMGWNSQYDGDTPEAASFTHSTWGRVFNPFTHKPTHPLANKQKENTANIVNVGEVDTEAGNDDYE